MCWAIQNLSGNSFSGYSTYVFHSRGLALPLLPLSNPSTLCRYFLEQAGLADYTAYDFARMCDLTTPFPEDSSQLELSLFYTLPIISSRIANTAFHSSWPVQHQLRWCLRCLVSDVCGNWSKVSLTPLCSFHAMRTTSAYHASTDRSLYLYGLCGLCTMLFILGFLGLVPHSHRKEASLATGCIMLVWAMCYQLTVGTVCYSLVAELSTRRLQIKTVVLGRNL